MNSNYTHLTLVADRSGSMQSIKSDAEGGINSFIQEQSKKEGKLTLSLYEFDDRYDCIFNMVNLNSVKPEYKLVPRGNTALIDSLYRAIVETGEKLASLPESERPGLVLFLVVTDGYENASHEVTQKKLAELIKQQQNIYNWKFTFLGANQDAILTATSMGINTVGNATFKPQNIRAAYQATSDKFGRMRSNVASGQNANLVSNAYTQTELNTMDNK